MDAGRDQNERARMSSLPPYSQPEEGPVFIIRRAKNEDLGTLLKLAKMVHFINLPADKDILSSKISQSRNSFTKAAGGNYEVEDGVSSRLPEPKPSGGKRKGKSGAASGLRPTNGPGDRSPPRSLTIAGQYARSDLFMFILEDTDSRSVLGTSQIVAHMGGPGNPNLSFKLTAKEFFSESLQYGTTHMTAKLFLDETGPTEMGGLILQPSYRNTKDRLGRFLSLVRFHFIGLHRELFAERLLAEMMAPISTDGQNILWEYLGRRFINLTYTEADRFCQYSREFMYNLLPREEIYLTLLPPEARNVVGQVGPETVPARRMLEKLGFKYNDFIDPFDGGPHLEAVTADVEMVKQTRWTELGSAVTPASARRRGMVSRLEIDGEFRSAVVEFADSDDGRVRLTKAAMEALAFEPGMKVGVTPAEAYERGPGGAASAGTTNSMSAASGVVANETGTSTGQSTGKAPTKRSKKKAASV